LVQRGTRNMELIIRIWVALGSRFQVLVLRARGVRIDGKCWFGGVHIPRNPWDIAIGSGAMLDKNVTLLSSGQRGQKPRIIVGPQTYINRNTFIDASELVEIGAGCLIGPFCYLTDHDHDLQSNCGALINKATIIEKGCWLGAHVTVLKGVTVGAGSIVGAGSVVTKSVPRNSLAVGNPARVIRAREVPEE
jgi:serine acetyltransferase